MREDPFDDLRLLDARDNFDVPYDAEGYIHRIRHTGRAGRADHAILFVMPRERRMLAAIERTTRQKVEPMALPMRKDVVYRQPGSATDVCWKQGL